MPKITVRDTFKEFHTFIGDVFAVEQDGGCRIFSRNLSGPNKLLQSFGPHVFGWVRVEQDQTSAIETPAPSLDRYTQSALAAINPADRPSIKPEPAEDDTHDFNQDDKSVKLTAAGMKAVEEIKAEQSPARPRPSRARKKDKDAEAATMAAAQEAGLLPGAEPQDAPAPKLDDLLDSGMIRKGAQDAGIAGAMANSVMDESGPEPDEVIRDAEERHQARQSCATCKGRGTIPDPDSQDPLDTMICPDC